MNDPTRTAVARWAGARRFDAETGRGGRLEIQSADGLPGARPTELLLAALAACAGLDVVSILEKKRQAVARYGVTATGEVLPGHPGTFSTISVDHEVAGPDLDAEAVRRAIELSATRYCPVSAMLSAGDTRITHRFRVDGSEGPELTDVIVTGPHGRGLSIGR